MDPQDVICVLRAHERDLRSLGVEALAVFGSVARGESRPTSDVDILVRLDTQAKHRGLAYIGQLADIEERLVSLLGRPVDIVTEPVRKDRLRNSIERDRVVAFG